MSGVLKAKVGGVWVPIVGSGMTAEVARWNSAWGVVAQASATSSQMGFGNTITNVTGLAVAFTPVAGRTYRTTATLEVYVTSGAGTLVSCFILDGPGNGMGQRDFSTTAVNQYVPLHAEILDVGLATTLTYRKVALQAVAGAMQTVSSMMQAGRIMVEDVGPTIYNPAPPPVNTPTAWVAPALLNGWTQQGGGYTKIGYRKIGDIVYLRGNVASGGTTGSPVFILPVEFRPPDPVNEFASETWTGAVRGVAMVRVDSNGNVIIEQPTGATFNGIHFSTTA
jgi:hypothetical protein